MVVLLVCVLCERDLPVTPRSLSFGFDRSDASPCDHSGFNDVFLGLFGVPPPSAFTLSVALADASVAEAATAAEAIRLSIPARMAATAPGARVMTLLDAGQGVGWACSAAAAQVCSEINGGAFYGKTYLVNGDVNTQTPT